MSLLVQLSILLASALILVPLAKRLGLSSILAFLLTGIVLGPNLFDLDQSTALTAQLTQVGTLSLLFLLGLQLRPQRLWQLRGEISRLGGLYWLITSIVLMLPLLLLFELSLPISLILAAALSLASSSLLQQLLQQQQLLNSRFGQQSFSLLMLQGMSALLLLALSPLFLAHTQNIHHDIAYLASLVAALSGLFLMGRYVMRPLQRFLSHNSSTELLMAVAVLQSILVFLILTALAIPATVSALLAGILLADTEFRHEFEVGIAPFKGIFIGMFFIGIGMSLNLNVLFSQSLWLLTALIGLIVVKALCLFAVAYFYQRKWQQPLLLSMSFVQAGEIGFVVIQLLFNANHLNPTQYQLLLFLVTLSMLSTPLLFWYMRRYILPKFKKPTPELSLDQPPQLIIAGFGRSGQIIARIAHIQQRPFVVIDNSPVQLQTLQGSSAMIIEGDATEIETLLAAGIKSAQVFVLAIDDVESSMHIARHIRLHYPTLCLIARARDRHHLHLLKELGISHIWRETYLSSLGMAYQTLCQLGTPAPQAQQCIENFRDHDETLIAEQQRIYTDDKKVYESYGSFIEELNCIFESDQSALERNDTEAQSDCSPHPITSVPRHAQDRIDITKNECD